MWKMHSGHACSLPLSASPTNTYATQHTHTQIKRAYAHQHRKQFFYMAALHCNALQHTATHCNTLQRIATHCHTRRHAHVHLKKKFFKSTFHGRAALAYNATHCNIL